MEEMEEELKCYCNYMRILVSKQAEMMEHVAIVMDESWNQ